MRQDMPEPGLTPSRFLARFREKLAERDRRYLMNRRMLIPRFLMRPCPSVVDIGNRQLTSGESEEDAHNEEEEAPFNFGDN